MVNPSPDQEGTPGMCGESAQQHRVCRACTPPRSRPPPAGPHTRSLSWHHSHACYRMSSPCASASPAQRYPCLHPVCGPIYQGTHGDWQKSEGTCLPHHIAQGRRPCRTASVYVTSAPGSVNLKIGISNLAGTSHFFSLPPLWPLHLRQWPAVSLTVEYPSESGAPLSGEEGGEPPPHTTVHWDLGGHLRRCPAPAQVASLASAISSTVKDLPLDKFCLSIKFIQRVRKKLTYNLDKSSSLDFNIWSMVSMS